jgi:hypothetical protein
MPLNAFKDSWPEWNSAGLQERILWAELPHPRRTSAARFPALPGHNLSFVFVEIKRHIEFRLSQQQLLHARLVLEKFVGLAGTRSRPLHAGFAPLKEYGSFQVRSVISTSGNASKMERITRHDTKTNSCYPALRLRTKLLAVMQRAPLS